MPCLGYNLVTLTLTVSDLASKLDKIPTNCWYESISAWFSWYLPPGEWRGSTIVCNSYLSTREDGALLEIWCGINCRAPLMNGRDRCSRASRARSVCAYGRGCLARPSTEHTSEPWMETDCLVALCQMTVHPSVSVECHGYWLTCSHVAISGLSAAHCCVSATSFPTNSQARVTFISTNSVEWFAYLEQLSRLLRDLLIHLDRTSWTLSFLSNLILTSQLRAGS